MRYLSFKLNEPYVMDMTPTDDFVIPTMYPDRLIKKKSISKEFVKSSNK